METQEEIVPEKTARLYELVNVLDLMSFDTPF